jgi:HAD superfamily hydrolase (TIGR01509 family)
MFKAIFFDVDETLVDAAKCHRQANALVFEQYGIDFQMVKDAVKGVDFIGMKVDVFMQKMKEAVGLDEKEAPLVEFLKLRKEMFLSLVEKEASLMPGAKEALVKAKELGMRVALVSSGEKDYLELLIKKFSLLDYIDFIVSAEDVMQGKPAPDCYLLAYQRLADSSIGKEEVLVVEDSANGITAGHTAGLKTVVVPFRDYPNAEIDADYVVQSLNELVLNKFYS